MSYPLENTSSSSGFSTFIGLKYAAEATIAALSVQYFIFGANTLKLPNSGSRSSNNFSRSLEFAATPPARTIVFEPFFFAIFTVFLINVDVIVQSFGEHITKDIAFTVKMNDLKKTLEVLEKNKKELGFQDVLHSENLSKVSIIGVGIANKPGVAADMFEALYENNINMHMISTSEIKISVLVNSNQADLAVNSIHKKFFGE